MDIKAVLNKHSSSIYVKKDLEANHYMLILSCTFVRSLYCILYPLLWKQILMPL